MGAFANSISKSYHLVNVEGSNCMVRVFENISSNFLSAHGSLDAGVSDSLILILVVFGAISFICIFFLRIFLVHKQRTPLHSRLDPTLLQYVRGNVAAGVSHFDIELGLIRAGWTREQIAQAFAVLMLPSATPEARLPVPPRWLEILRVGLAFTFFTNSIIAFAKPAEFTEFIGGSVVFSPLAQLTFFPVVIMVHDFLLAILLSTGVFPKIVGWWSALWITGVLSVALSQQSGITLDSLTEVFAHGASLAIAIILAFSS